jgi:LPXTG-site transpeptidase (sortase) family protein
MKIESKKLVWLLRILGIVLILAGVGVIFAPKIQNMFSIKDQEKALVEWRISEEQYDEKLKEIKEEEKLELKEGKPPADFPLRMLIPVINLDTMVFDGTDRETLKKGPGHIIGTSYPGSIGTVAISGHRTTYGAPFFNIDKLKAGDEITLESFDTIYRYIVTELMIVEPTDVWVLNPTPYPSLVLTTCNPKYSAKERLIIFAKMVGDPEDK